MRDEERVAVIELSPFIFPIWQQNQKIHRKRNELGFQFYWVFCAA
jgi:hypothetical protein